MNERALILDKEAKHHAANFLHSEGQILLVLLAMREERVFAVLNYSGVFDYCTRALRLSNAQAQYYKKVAEKPEEVPEIKEAVVNGELSLSKARRIAPVVTPENHAERIEKEVAAVNPNAKVKEKIRPVAKELSELKVPVTDETEENLRVRKELLSQ